MNKFMRILSTLMVAVGLVFLFVYVRSFAVGNTDILDQPSYYTVRNYWFMFVAGIITIAFSILGSFFSWFKTMDPVKEALPNAGYASANDINTWVEGTTADAGAETEILTENIKQSAIRQTEVLRDSETTSGTTEVLLDEQSSDDSKTEILQEEDTL